MMSSAQANHSAKQMMRAGDEQDGMHISNLSEIDGPKSVQPGTSSQDLSGNSEGIRQKGSNPKYGSQTSDEEYSVPENYANLAEVDSTAPVENPEESRFYRHSDLEEIRSEEREYRSRSESESQPPHISDDKAKQERVSKLATQLYTISYLIVFSILGTLARLGLQALTFYPGAPVATGVLWPNFAGSLIMGFVSEDRKLFRDEWGKDQTFSGKNGKFKADDEENRQGRTASQSKRDAEATFAALRNQHSKVKKTIPLYIGIATGFCGSFTSFSSFIRDVFLTLSNDLPTPVSHPHEGFISSSSTAPRYDGYSVMAILAVIILTVTVSLGGLKFGAHLAIAVQPFMPSLPFRFIRKLLDRAAVVLALGFWLAAVLMAILPPDRPSGPLGRGNWAKETWRGQVLFALVFAPIGCLGRFYASIYLNGIISAFPLGTFTVNVFGTIILGISWDLQHARPSVGGMLSCQVLQGIEDGFCGCLTTVSTWVVELNSLRRKHAYFYGLTSVVVSLAFLVVIMGSMKWTQGFAAKVCV